MIPASWSIILLLLPGLVSSLPFPRIPVPRAPRRLDLPFSRRRAAVEKRDDDDGPGLASTLGIGNIGDLFYTIALKLGDTTTTVNLDTGSSDLWVMSEACKTTVCERSNATPYRSKTQASTGAEVDLQYGDSITGSHAAGPIVMDEVTVAGLSMGSQIFAAVNDTNNVAVSNGGAGIFGLGFPTQSFVEAAVVNVKFDTPQTTDNFVNSMANYGPLLSRLAMSGQIEQPMFSITLQRNTIDISGQGRITIGQLPDGVDNSSITWVPVRLYNPNDGGLNPPTFAPNEVYPLRWEIPLEAVFLDGKKLPDTTMTGTSQQLSALVDTGNSLIRGPQDVVTNVLKTVSPAFEKDLTAEPTLPCTSAHKLSFQIGGKQFPLDPRDFVAQHKVGDATTCVANNVVATDPPSKGALFSWSLGDPFFKSNLVVFYYGNLTHPSVDPPRIGFLSTVPQNADDLLQDAVEDAKEDGGVFESTVDIAPTAATVETVSPSGTVLQTATVSAATLTANSVAALPAATGAASANDDSEPEVVTAFVTQSGSAVRPSGTAESAAQRTSSGSIPRFDLGGGAPWYAAIAVVSFVRLLL